MEEYTNSTEFVEDDLFADDTEPTSTEEAVAEQSEDVRAEAQEPNEEAKEQPKEQPKEKLRGKYNGKEVEWDYDEAVVLAQKGMNYDKVHAELEKVKNSPSMKVLAEYARESGYNSVDEYVAEMEQNLTRVSVQRELTAIKTKSPDIPDDVAMELAESRVSAKMAKMQLEEGKRKEAAEREKLKPWIDYNMKFPDTPQPPDGVIEKVRAGMSPVEAMLEYKQELKDKEISELKMKLEAQEKNKQNKNKSVGSAASTAASAPVDAFLVGLSG